MKKQFILFFLLNAIASIGYTQTVTIGEQIWSTKNLNVDKFRNGDPIPEAKTEEEWRIAGENKMPAWCYYNNDPVNGEKYGKLYNWYAVKDKRGLAPAGFHIPIYMEYRDMIDYLGGEQVAGKKIKSTSGWNDEGNGSNLTGFSGLPGGFRSKFGRFFNAGKIGIWWTTMYPGEAYIEPDIYTYYYLEYQNDIFNHLDTSKAFGLSVRCIKD